MKKIVIISSVIYPKHKAFSYSSVRSAFSEEERYQQTLETVKSIQKYVKNADILRIEAGIKDVQNDVLMSLGIRYNYIGANRIVRFFVDGKFKGAGESVLLFFGTMGFSFSPYNFVYKISGRYLLNSSFSSDSFQYPNKFSFFKVNYSYHTILYAFASSLVWLWRFYLLVFVLFSFSGLSLEFLWGIFLPKIFVHKVNKLGVQGQIGVNGEKVSL